MGTISGSADIEIEAPIEAVYAVAADAEGATRWQQEIQQAECLERDAEGNQVRVRIETETSVKNITSTLRYTHLAPTEISWVQEEGDLKSVRGSWKLEDLSAGRTRVRYELAVDPGRILGLALRGPVLGALRGKMIDTMPAKLKAFVESQSA